MAAVGAEANYAYTGDYVLGANVKLSVKAIPSPLDTPVVDDKGKPIGASIASDHKLVVAIVEVPMAGGRRSRKTRRSRVAVAVAVENSVGKAEENNL